ncbi:MAG TPA: hypothetical protein VFA75_11695 [Nevskia sp.]|nr:hypothetical protein [Nevskia sp.]
MKRKQTLILAALGAALVPAIAAAQVGVSVNIGEPGFYGQINIGDLPQPQVIYSQPVVVDRVPESYGPPLYLRVPPGHAKHWAKHCAEYNACGHQVYFVRDDWYNRVVVPRYHGGGRGDWHGDDDRGPGHGDHGRGHGHGDHGDHGRGHDHGG